MGWYNIVLVFWVFTVVGWGFRRVCVVSAFMILVGLE